MIEGLNQMLSQQNLTNNSQGQLVPSLMSQSTKITLHQAPHSRDNLVFNNKVKAKRNKLKTSDAEQNQQTLIKFRQRLDYV